jgi:ABC-2 type transport system permease protein
MGGGRFEEGASTQLLLFIFLNSLIAASALIEARRLGVARRMLSTPTPVRTILAGEALGRLGIALVQAAIIILGSALLFGVDWGSPTAVAALVLAFCLVGCGAGMLLGSTLRNEQQAGAVALLVGLGLAAFGGSMVPLEVFPDAVRTAAHSTPHAWGNDAFSDLLADGGSLADVLPEIAVLLSYAAVLLALATWRLHAALTR